MQGIETPFFRSNVSEMQSMESRNHSIAQRLVTDVERAWRYPFEERVKLAERALYTYLLDTSELIPIKEAESILQEFQRYIPQEIYDSIIQKLKTSCHKE